MNIESQDEAIVTSDGNHPCRHFDPRRSLIAGPRHPCCRSANCARGPAICKPLRAGIGLRNPQWSPRTSVFLGRCRPFGIRVGATRAILAKILMSRKCAKPGVATRPRFLRPDARGQNRSFSPESPLLVDQDLIFRRATPCRGLGGIVPLLCAIAQSDAHFYSPIR